MAHVWLRLAEDNHEMVARSKAAEEAQPAVQQQVACLVSMGSKCRLKG